MKHEYRTHEHHTYDRRHARPDDHRGLHEGRGSRQDRGHRGRGGRLARFLEHGDLRLLVLHLIAEKPSHGYELIKAIETLAGGDYAPSPGIIYPTLTLLEELGQVESMAEGARKRYAITPGGTAHLTEQAQTLAALLARIDSARPRTPDAPIVRAGDNLRQAVRLKLNAAEHTPALIRQIADIMDSAARQIEDLAA
jgi:DNA-binding PadR family transcriptional regulator